MKSNYPQDTSELHKQFIDGSTLQDASYRLACDIYRSGFYPDYIVAIWRGGTGVGIYIHETLHYLGVHADHIAIRTSSYTGIGERERTIKVHGLHYIVENVESEDKLLIVDDVFDTGLSILQVISDINKLSRKNTPQIKVAVPYFKPGNNQTSITPDYYTHMTSDWLIFPHELQGLTEQEIRQHKGDLIDYLHALQKQPT